MTIERDTDREQMHTLLRFSDFDEYITFCEKNNHMDTEYVRGYGETMSRDFNGAINMGEAVAMARNGLPVEGIEAFEIADEKVNKMEAELIDQRFHAYRDVEGGSVDISRYLDGDPECMITFRPKGTPRVQPIITLVVATGVLGHVSTEAIQKRGQKVMQLLEAIERVGLQTEIWSDSTTGDNSHGSGKTGRIAVRIKEPGQVYDASLFMFVMTSPAMHRVFNFNCKYEFPSPWDSWARNGGMGSTVHRKFVHPEDFPEGSIYLPALRDNYDTWNVEDTLIELGIMNETQRD